ncbi:hypothetical protein [Ancylobacter radicis]|uniref:Sulfotransferase family protein n=1 Tax=Ancylobacter radicis TaxID=2836179 RepID=A0ABS5R7K3_9HYPH|nr:hypothetical protein [Ancylobacter radicis]MBS9477636.1 hypothetical protein [Ancylobacter radicis]
MHHLVITGTGRAGTSFLVQYLHHNGFDTHLGRHPEATLDAAANAGLEDHLLTARLGSYPYVVKSPWIALNPETAIPPEVTVDAFIVPVRALEEAAASRVILERAAMHRSAPWMAEMPASFDHWGPVPGGMVYALSVEDQARILAVGFHNLVQYAIRRDIPLVFLDFPRFIEDGDYLFSQLSAVLPMERERALAAHAVLSDRSLVRTGDELRAAGGRGPAFVRGGGSPCHGPGTDGCPSSACRDAATSSLRARVRGGRACAAGERRPSSPDERADRGGRPARGRTRGTARAGRAADPRHGRIARHARRYEPARLAASVAARATKPPARLSGVSCALGQPCPSRLSSRS